MVRVWGFNVSRDILSRRDGSSRALNLGPACLGGRE